MSGVKVEILTFLFKKKSVCFVLTPQGLKYRRSVAGKTAVFNGKEVILEETDWYLLDLFRLWWRYGISFIRLQMWVEEIMEKFMRYEM